MTKEIDRIKSQLLKHWPEFWIHDKPKRAKGYHQQNLLLSLEYEPCIILNWIVWNDVMGVFSPEISHWTFQFVKRGPFCSLLDHLNVPVVPGYMYMHHIAHMRTFIFNLQNFWRVLYTVAMNTCSQILFLWTCIEDGLIVQILNTLKVTRKSCNACNLQV